MFRYVWNSGIDYLKSLGVLDRYGRVTLPPKEAIDAVIASGEGISVTDALLQHIIGTEVLAEWTTVYPKTMLALPIYQLAERFEKCTGKFFRLCYLKLGDWDMDVVIPIKSLTPDLKDIYINKVVRGDYLDLEIRMQNIVGNNIRLVIESNTSRMDEFLTALSNSEQHIIHMSTWISRSQHNKRKGKLLCSFIIEEDCHDSDNQ